MGNQLTQLAMLQALQKLSRAGDDGADDGRLIGAGKALKKVHDLQDRVKSRPQSVVADYIEETMEALGAERGDVWRLSDTTALINWGKMRGLHRTHFHISRALQYLLRREGDQGAAYLVQILKSLHQFALDQGQWPVRSTSCLEATR